jgi:hypothetical protein
MAPAPIGGRAYGHVCRQPCTQCTILEERRIREQLGCILEDGYQAAKAGFREASEAVVARTRCSELDRTATLVYRESYCGVLFGVPPDVIPE